MRYLRGSGDGGFDALLIAELVLESGLPRPRPASVAVTAVGEDDHAAGVGIGELSVVAPPCGNAIGGEDGGVAGGSDEDGAGIGAQVVDAIGDGDAASEGTQVVVVDLLGIAVPFGAGVLESADQLLLLGIDADDGDVFAGAPPAQDGDVCELGVPLRVVDAQGIAHGAKQLGDGAGANADAGLA